MIKIIFTEASLGGRRCFLRFSAEGHSGYAAEGSDIVCAAVSACSMLAANTLTEQFGLPAIIEADAGRALFSLDISGSAPLLSEGEGFSRVGYAVRGCLAGLYAQLLRLRGEYPQYIEVKTVKL